MTNILFVDPLTNPLKCLIFKSDSKLIILKMLTRVWRIGAIINPFFLGVIASMTVTSDDKYVISASFDQSIKVFDLQTKQQVHHFENTHQGFEIEIDYKFIF